MLGSATSYVCPWQTEQAPGSALAQTSCSPPTRKAPCCQAFTPRSTSLGLGLTLSEPKLGKWGRQERQDHTMGDTASGDGQTVEGAAQLGSATEGLSTQ